MLKLPRLLIIPLMLFALWSPLRGLAMGKSRHEIAAAKTTTQQDREQIKASPSANLLLEETPTVNLSIGRLATTLTLWLRGNDFELANCADAFLLHQRASASDSHIVLFYRQLLYPFHAFL